MQPQVACALRHRAFRPECHTPTHTLVAGVMHCQRDTTCVLSNPPQDNEVKQCFIMLARYSLRYMRVFWEVRGSSSGARCERFISTAHLGSSEAHISTDGMERIARSWCGAPVWRLAGPRGQSSRRAPAAPIADVRLLITTKACACATIITYRRHAWDTSSFAR